MSDPTGGRSFHDLAGEPGPDTVLVHLAQPVPLHDPLAARHLAILDAGERERFERFRVSNAREEFLTARALLRTTLGELTATDPSTLAFETNAYGRPRLVGGSPFTFNLSHTRGLVALAVAAKMPEPHAEGLGVDVEAVDRVAASEDLAERYFTPDEAVFIRDGGTAARERFFGLWTLKEAYIKARGMGLALPLDGFAFDGVGPEPAIRFSSIADESRHWRFACRAIGERHRLALCMSSAVRRVVITRIGPLAASAPRVETIELTREVPA